MTELLIKKVELVEADGNEKFASYVFTFGTVEPGRASAEFTVAVKTKGIFGQAEHQARQSLRALISRLEVPNE